MFCQHCGAQLPEGAKFCQNCGTKVEVEQPQAEEVKQEVVDARPKEEPKKSSSKFTDEEIAKMREELANHARRKRNFVTAGSILLGVGIFLTVLGIVLLSVSIVETAYSTEYYGPEIAGIVFGYIFTCFGPFMAIGGGALLAIGHAVFGKKADNRRRAIQEHEQGR